MEEEEETLRDLIKGKLKIRIDSIWLKAEEEYHSIQKGDNLQGTEHCKSVETSLCKIISYDRKKKLKQIDLFLLSGAACLHDIGKIDAKEGEDHGIRSMQIILEHYKELGLDRAQAVAIAYIVSVHANGRLDELPKNPMAVGVHGIVDIIELAAIFRLADILDTTSQRSPEILSDIKFQGRNIPSKWRGRQSITGWYFNKKNKIILQATPKNNDEIEAVHTLWAMINEDLSSIRPYLEPNGYPNQLGKLEISDIFLGHKQKRKTGHRHPFPGMAFYTKDDAHAFKGRDREIDDLLSIVSAYPITLLIGESGAGKTSLIHAGLFPLLDNLSWEYIWTRPFDNPVENTRKILWATFFEGEPNDEMQLLDVMKQAAEKCKPHKLLLVIDQCEDVLNCNVEGILDDFCLALMVVQGITIPNLKVLISFRDDALVKLNTRLLRRVTGSFRHFPSIELERLTRDGAREAFLAGLERAGIQLDSPQEEGEKELIELILDDIQKRNNRLYPPYLQMVAETLCKKIDRNNPIITREMYFELGQADNIIANYLVELLVEFGPRKGKAERVLIFLTSSVGEKVQKSLAELHQETEIELDELKEIIDKMIDLRMVQNVSADKFEIIHDYLSGIIVERLVEEEDRTIKFLKEQLSAFYRNYSLHGEPISSHLLMTKLYRYRRRIRIDEEQYPLILCTILGKDAGLGWYWLRDLDKRRLLEMIKEHMSHEMRDIRDHAVRLFLEIAKPEDKNDVTELVHDIDSDVQRLILKTLEKKLIPEYAGMKIEQHFAESLCSFPRALQTQDKDKIIKMFYDNMWYVRRAAVEALGKLATPEDKDKIIKMLRDVNPDVREATLRLLEKLGTPEDKDKIIKMFYDNMWYVRRAAVEALGKLATPEDKDKIIKMLRDVNPDVREATLRLLEKLGTPEDKDEIIKMLRDEDLDVREAATRAFIMISTLEDKDQIIKMLRDEDVSVWKAAARTLAVIATPEDKENLLDLLSDEVQGYSERQIDLFYVLSELDKMFYCPYYES